MKFKKSLFMIGMLTSLAVCTTCIPDAVHADEAESSTETPIYSDDFESDNISGWGILGGVGEMSLDTSTSQSGSSCLTVSGRTHSFNGPSIAMDKYIDTEETYRITGWVRHESSQTETINCTLRLSDSVNVDSYVGIAVIEAEPSEWTYFEGTVDTPEDISSSLIYFESPNETMSFSIDNINIYGKAPEIPEAAEEKAGSQTAVSSYLFDFESGFGDWIKRGNTRIIRTDEQQCTGNYSILATNREKVWNGPAVSIDGIEREKEYVYEANVLYTDKKADDLHTFLLEVQYTYNGNEVYQFISEATAEKNVWTKISGPMTIPEGAANVTLYLQTANLEEGAEPTPTDLVSFYVDDVKVIRGDLAVPGKLSLPIIAVIAAGVIAVIILITVIMKTISSGSKKNEDKEGVGDLIEALNNSSSENAADSSGSSENTADSSGSSEKTAEKSENKSDKKDNEKTVSKPEAASEVSEKKEEKKTENNKTDSEDKKSGSEKKEPARENSEKKQSDNSGNSSGTNSSKKKNKKSSADSKNSSAKPEESKPDTAKSEETKSESSKLADSEKHSSDSKKETKNEKPAHKESGNEKPEHKESKSAVSSSDDSRTRDIFNIETFSYEEEAVRYDEATGDQIADDDPLEAPGDNPFDGF